MRKFAIDYLTVEAPKIISENKRWLKVQACITKAGVYKYDDGMALKPAKELLRAVRTARAAKVTLGDHPKSKVIMQPGDMYGQLESPFWRHPKMFATLAFDKQICTEEQLAGIRSGKANDVSIGFYYTYDPTPGWDRDVNTGRPVHYDYVMRNILIDHIVGAVQGKAKGRCSFPNCGIGVDTFIERLAFETDKVVKRGEQWCVVHCHPDGSIGKTIKCFPTREKAEAMHRAIQARKAGSTTDMIIDLARLGIDFSNIDGDTHALFFGDAEQPSKAWMDNCKAKAKSFADDPGAFCGWVWYHGPSALKQSFGSSSVSTKGGKDMSEELSANVCFR